MLLMIAFVGISAAHVTYRLSVRSLVGVEHMDWWWNTCLERKDLTS